MQYKKCNTCKEVRPIETFHKNPSNKTDGRRASCGRCSNKKNRGANARWRNYNYGKKYGITVNDYDKMLSIQGGRCKICGEDDPSNSMRYNNTFCVDHCHTTNKVRGLLCNHCNRGLGYFRDNIGFMKNAIDYLEKE